MQTHNTKKTKPRVDNVDSEYDYQDERVSIWERLVGSIRLLGCGCSVLIILFILFSCYVIFARPPQVINPIKEWLNVNITAQPATKITLEQASERLNRDLSSFEVGENTLEITEEELRAIINARSQKFKTSEIFVDVQSGLLKVFWNSTEGADIPLWMVLEIKVKDGSDPYISKIGTERISAPGFLNELLTNAILKVLDITGVANGSELSGILIPLPQNAQIKGIELKEDLVKVVIEVQTGLDNVFEF